MTVLRHDLTVHMVPIDEIARHPDNYNHGDVEAIEESVLTNGLYTPLVVQRSTGYILVGNHRYETLLSLGEELAPVTYLDVDDMAALRILSADNAIARLAIVDVVALGELLAKIADTDAGLIGTGHVDNDLERLALMTQAIEEPFKANTDYDGVKQRNINQITCPACGHQFGGHR